MLLRRPLGTVAARLEPDAVDGRVDLGDAEDLLDLLGHVGVLRQVDRLAAEGAGLRQPLRVHVADDHDGGAEQVAGGGAGEPDRAAPATYTVEPVVTPAV